MSKTILLIEDEQALSSIVRDKLLQKNKDYKIITAADGIDGLNTALQQHPDLIVLDLLMPEMDGVTMLTKLRQDAWGATVPVVVLSNLGDSGHVFQSLEYGALDYLVKTDWSLDGIADHIDERLKSLPAA